MPGTAESEIYDLFMQLCTDYRLTALFNTSETDFENYLESWLIFGINDFNVCNQELVLDTTTKTFSVTLGMDNKVILANLMIKYWLMKNVNDITQMNLHVIDKDFKVYSEAQNLREKQMQLNLQTERCSQMLIDYSYRKTVDWTSWYIQDFSGG